MKTYLSSVLWALAIIIAAIILGNAYIKRNKSEGQIGVIGLGKKDFTSDLIVWEGSFTKENMDLKVASAALNKDKALIEDYLTKKGITSKEMVFSSIGIEELQTMRYSSSGEIVGQDFAGYRLSQSVEITSSNIEKVENISRNITELLNDGVQFNSEAPRYYYTKLADLKIQLISEATKDARDRAEKIAEMSGSRLGKLQNAHMGVFQITGQNSNEEFSWGGTFNTTSKEKSATINMKLYYGIR